MLVFKMFRFPYCTAFVLFCIQNYQNCFLLCLFLLNIMFWFFNAESRLPVVGTTVVVVVDVLWKMKSVHVDTKKCHLSYQTRYYHWDNGLLTTCTISEASSFLFPDTLLFSLKHRSLVLCYFAASDWDFSFILQLLEASITDKVLVVWSSSARRIQVTSVTRFVNTYFLALTHSSNWQVLSGVSHLQFFKLHSPFSLLQPFCWQLNVSPALQS